MASTYSTNLALDLMANGDQSGTWGTTNNTNLGTLIEQAISGYVTQAITDGSGANTTITIPNGATGVARNMVIEMTGALSFSTTSLIVPANKKLYFIFNNTSGGFAVTVKVSGQTGVLVPNGKKVILTSNGTDIVEAANQVVGAFGVGGALTVTGAATVGTTLGVTGTSTMGVINAGGKLTVSSTSVTQNTRLITTGTAGFNALTFEDANPSITDFGVVGATTTANKWFLGFGASPGALGSAVLTWDRLSAVTMAAAVSVGTTLSVTGTSTMAAINATGDVTLGGSGNSFYTGAAGVFGARSAAGAGVTLTATADGVAKFTDWNATGPMRIGIGGISASFPALKRSGTTLAIRLADDSADAPISTAAINASGNVTVTRSGSTAQFALNSASGTALNMTDNTVNGQWLVNANVYAATFSIYNLDRASHDISIANATGAVTIPGTLGVTGVTTIGAASAGVGTLTINNAVQPTIYLAKTNATATTWQIYNNGNLGFSDGTNTPLYFVGADSVFSSTGFVKINGAGSNGLVSILGRSAVSGLYVQRSNTAASFTVDDDGNVYAGQIGASTGTALILSGGYIKTLTSSRRYKKDEEPIDIGLDFINTLKPIKFRLKENDLPQVGFIAEDFPDERLVDMSYIDIEKKELGMRPESVHYSQITAPLVKAVQELSAKVAALEAAQ